MALGVDSLVVGDGKAKIRDAIALPALNAGLFDMVRASLVGAILANLLLATAAIFVARYFLGQLPAATQQAAHVFSGTNGFVTFPQLGWAFRIAYSFAMVNVFLAVFNLIPVPPLDGSAVFELVMPRSWLPGWYKFRPYGLLVLFAVVFWTGLVGVLLDPFIRTVNALVIGP